MSILSILNKNSSFHNFLRANSLIVHCKIGGVTETNGFTLLNGDSAPQFISHFSHICCTRKVYLAPLTDHAPSSLMLIPFISPADAVAVNIFIDGGNLGHSYSYLRHVADIFSFSSLSALEKPLLCNVKEPTVLARLQQQTKKRTALSTKYR